MPLKKKSADLYSDDLSGRLHMVDVSAKPETFRQATAQGQILVSRKIIKTLREGKTPKGNVFAAARLAGILAAKKTAELIPLCHPLPLSSITIDFKIKADRIFIFAEVSATAATGVEMEALTAVAVAALTFYDMLKIVSHDLSIENIQLLSKTGGKSGTWQRKTTGSPVATPLG